SHITDLRDVANPRKHPELRTYALLAGDSANLTTTTPYPGGQTWPTAVESAWGEIAIPSWATLAKVIMTWAGARTNGGTVFGHTWVQIGTNANPNNVKTQAVRYDFENSTEISREVLLAADMVRIPAA